MSCPIINLTSSLISIPSTKENLSALKKVLDEALAELKEFTIEKFEKNNIPSILVYRGKTRPKRFKVILNAHLDVVPGKPEQFKPKIKDGKLYGRGAYDMKGAGAAEILVFKELAKKLPYPIGLQLVTDEEVGGFAGTKYQIEKGVRADFVVAGEPTDLALNNKAKGIIWVKISTAGKSAHGAYPWEGENAIVKLNKLLNELFVLYPIPEKESWKTTINLARIETENKTFNKVPDNAIAFLDIRYIPEDKERIKKDLKRIAEKYKAKLEFIFDEPAQFTDQNSPYVKALKKSVEKITGKKAKVIVKHGGSDIRHYNAVGCEGVTFGPVGAGHHTDSEWVDIKSLENYYAILKDFLLSLDK